MQLPLFSPYDAIDPSHAWGRVTVGCLCEVDQHSVGSRASRSDAVALFYWVLWELRMTVRVGEVISNCGCFADEWIMVSARPCAATRLQGSDERSDPIDRRQWCQMSVIFDSTGDDFPSCGQVAVKQLRAKRQAFWAHVV